VNDRGGTRASAFSQVMRWPNVIAKKLACVVCAGSPSTPLHPSILEQLRAVISTAAADASNVAGFVFVIAFTPRKGERFGDVGSGSKDSVLNTALVQLDYPQGTARRRPLSSPLIWRSSATPSLQTCRLDLYVTSKLTSWKPPRRTPATTKRGRRTPTDGDRQHRGVSGLRCSASRPTNHIELANAFAPEERDQRRIDLVGVSPADVVRAARDLDHGQVVDQAIVAHSRRCHLEGTRSAVPCTARTLAAGRRHPNAGVTNRSRRATLRNCRRFAPIGGAYESSWR
jgi:hypothetical protein